MNSRIIKIIPFFFISVSASAGVPISLPHAPSASSIQLRRGSSQDLHQQNVRVAANFLALALNVWNPDLNLSETERFILDKVHQQGMLKGLIEPALALIDISYISGKPQFGRLLSPMIAQIAPQMGSFLNKNYNLPLNYGDQSFGQFMLQREQTIQEKMRDQLGQEFDVRGRSKQKEEIGQDIFSRGIYGLNSYFGYASKVMQKMEGEDSSRERKRDYSVSTPSANPDSEGRDFKRKMIMETQLQYLPKMASQKKLGDSFLKWTWFQQLRRVCINAP